MGKYILLTVFAVALGGAILASQGMETDIDTSESQAIRQKKVLARQIATSAFEMGVSELRRDFQNWRVERSNVSYENGTFDLTASGPSSGPVSLTAVGEHGTERYRLSATLRLDTLVRDYFHAITAQDEMNFNVSGPGCSGGPCVSGIDEAGNGDRHGINLWASDNSGDVESDVCSEFDGKVEGRESGCDVRARDEDRDEEVVEEMEGLQSRIEAMPPSEKTVCDDEGGDTCDLTGSETGDGVYYVTGDLTISGNAQWNGVMYVAEGGSVTINGGGGTKNINGGLMMEGNTDLTMHGGNRVQYDSEEILDLIGDLPTVARETVLIFDRNGKFLLDN